MALEELGAFLRELGVDVALVGAAAGGALVRILTPPRQTLGQALIQILSGVLAAHFLGPLLAFYAAQWLGLPEVRVFPATGFLMGYGGISVVELLFKLVSERAKPTASRR